MSDLSGNNRRTPPTIKELADLSGYSIGTISKALRGSPVVAQATKEAILKLAHEVGYEANTRGMSLRTGKTYLAAVLMPVTAVRDYEWDGVEYTQILSGISQALEGSDYNMSVLTIRNAQDGFDVARRVAERGLADGLIFSGILQDDPRIDYLVEAGFPFVSLGRCRKALDYAHVDVDNEWAAHAAVKRLLDGGHRRIALVNPQSSLCYAADRIDGLVRAFQDQGLEPSTDLVVGGDLSTRFGRESALELLGRENPPTAFVCVNESTTLGVLSGLSEAGRTVGADIDVISYDDINVSAYFSPPVTTFYQPIEALGRTLGEFLLKRMAGEEPGALKQVFRPALIARQPDNLGKSRT